MTKPLEALCDEELLQRIAKADRAAFAVLLERHLERVQGLGQRMLGERSEAEDVAQEIFLKLWRSPHLWQPGRAKFSSWLSRVCANACIDRIRRRKPLALEDQAEPVDPGAGPLGAALQAERARRVNQALQDLPERQRLAIVLCHYQGYSNKEGAQIMQVSVEAMESLLARARRHLKSALAKDVKALLHDE
ncbi:MAG TPA: RNA polymerase sigma factor [Rhizobiales bacterium]|nr:RNA polymerase sigma factor [Hyphomicrobiales bacterium]